MEKVPKKKKEKKSSAESQGKELKNVVPGQVCTVPRKKEGALEKGGKWAEGKKNRSVGGKNNKQKGGWGGRKHRKTSESGPTGRRHTQKNRWCRQLNQRVRGAPIASLTEGKIRWETISHNRSKAERDPAWKKYVNNRDDGTFKGGQGVTRSSNH